jgi:hypothetical protein
LDLKLLKQFDLVEILSAKNIRFVSGPPGKPAKPQGLWSVVGFIGSDIVIAKDETVVRAPLSAVSKVASFNTDIEQLKRTKRLKEDMDGAGT